MIYYQVTIRWEKVTATVGGDDAEPYGEEILYSSKDRTVIQGIYSKIVALVRALLEVGSKR